MNLNAELGAAYSDIQSGRYDSALSRLSSLQKSQSRAPDVWRLSAMAARKSGAPDQAELWLKTALKSGVHLGPMALDARSKAVRLTFSCNARNTGMPARGPNPLCSKFKEVNEMDRLITSAITTPASVPIAL